MLPRGRGRGAADGGDVSASPSGAKNATKHKRNRRPRAHHNNPDGLGGDVGEPTAIPSVLAAGHGSRNGASHSASRGGSPTTDDGCPASAVSCTSTSSTALQQLKERSYDEHKRRIQAFLRLEEEKESMSREDISNDEKRVRGQMAMAQRTEASVVAEAVAMVAQQRTASTFFLNREHNQQLEALEDDESEARDAMWDDELEALGAMIAHECNKPMPSGTGLVVDGGSETPTPAATPIEAAVSENEEDTATTLPHHETEPDPAEAAFAEFRSRETNIKNKRPEPPTAESICPCSMM